MNDRYTRIYVINLKDFEVKEVDILEGVYYVISQSVEFTIDNDRKYFTRVTHVCKERFLRLFIDLVSTLPKSISDEGSVTLSL